MAQVCVVVLMGLPGSGKTTLAKNLRKYYEDIYSVDTSSCLKGGPMGNVVTNESANNVECNISGEKFAVLHVSYDELMPNEKDLIDGSEGLSEWKLYRQDIVAEVYNIIHRHLGLTSPTRVVREEVRRHLQSVTNKPGVNLGHGRLIVIIDDNMYYRSMRYEYFQLCRELEISFAQVYVKCSMEDALMQNQRRSQRVEEDVIRDMVLKMEEPDLKDSWEKYSVIWQIGMGMEPITMVLTESVTNPLQDTVTQATATREAARVICSQSQMHQVDHILRTLVSDAIKALKSSGASAGVLKAKARAANETRTCVMLEVKNGTLLFPSDTDWAAAVQDQRSTVQQDIRNTFLKRFSSVDDTP